MDSLFINKTRRHFQVNDFLCDYDFIKQVEEQNILPASIEEIEYNEFADRKYFISPEGNKYALSSNLVNLCLSIIDKEAYYRQLAESSKEKLNIVEVLDAKKAELYEIKKALLYSPISFNNVPFSATENAQRNIIARITLASSEDEQIPWLDLADNPILLSLTDFRSLGRAILNRSSSLYFQEAIKIQELQTIQLDFGTGIITFVEALSRIQQVNFNFVTE